MALDMCSDCGEEKEVDDEFLCEECAADYSTCDSCGCINRPENMVDDRGYTLCHSCYY